MRGVETRVRRATGATWVLAFASTSSAGCFEWSWDDLVIGSCDPTVVLPCEGPATECNVATGVGGCCPGVCVDVQGFTPWIVEKRTRPIVIDGVPDEWSDASYRPATYYLAKRYDEAAGGRRWFPVTAEEFRENFNIEVAMAWDERALYAAARTIDDNVPEEADSIRVGNQDGLELWIDLVVDGPLTTDATADENQWFIGIWRAAAADSGERNFEAEAPPGSVPGRRGWAFSAGKARTATGWTMEMSLIWPDAYPMEPGKLLGVEWAGNDNDPAPDSGGDESLEGRALYFYDDNEIPQDFSKMGFARLAP